MLDANAWENLTPSRYCLAAQASIFFSSTASGIDPSFSSSS